MSEKQKNVLGEDLEECSNDPLTGWFRDGCCNTDENDHGLHTVCAKVTTECLEWMFLKIFQLLLQFYSIPQLSHLVYKQHVLFQ